MPIAATVFGFEFLSVKIITLKSGLATRFAEVKEERKARGTRSKTRRQPAPAPSHSLMPNELVTAEYSHACAKGSQASCPSA